MDHDRTYETPSKVAARDGKVIVDGPDGVAVTLTPAAALETSHRLLDGAVTAQGKRSRRTMTSLNPPENSNNASGCRCRPAGFCISLSRLPRKQIWAAASHP